MRSWGRRCSGAWDSGGVGMRARAERTESDFFAQVGAEGSLLFHDFHLDGAGASRIW
jgi:hypothetical protein